MRNSLYDRGWIKVHRLEVPVVSVGNLTMGGTGKSPMASLISRMLADRGARPAVVSRGYFGSHAGRATVVSDGREVKTDASVAGDEPVMLAGQLTDKERGVPVIVSRRRLDGGRLAVSDFGARCLVLDDGYQHRSLARDLDLLLLDGADPFGNGRMLPAGRLREPLTSMARAGALVITQADRMGREAGEVRQAARRHCPGAPLFHARMRPASLVEAASGRAGSLAHLRGAKIFCFAGIAHPDRFFADTEAAGAAVVGTVAFPDHHPYSTGDLEKVTAAAARARADLLLTTEKDAARLGPRRPQGLYALRIEAAVDEEDSFADLLRRAVP